MRDPFSLLHHSPNYPNTNNPLILSNSISLPQSSGQCRYSLAAFPLSLYSLFSQFFLCFALLPSILLAFLRTLVFCFCFFWIRILRLRVFFAHFIFAFFSGGKFEFRNLLLPRSFIPFHYLLMLRCFKLQLASSNLELFLLRLVFTNVRFVQ